MANEKIKRKIVYLFLYITLAYWVSANTNILTFRVLQFGIIIGLICLYKVRFLKKNVVIVYMLLGMAQLLTIIMKSYHYSIDFAQISAVTIAFLFTQTVSEEQFKEQYKNFMVFVAGFSICTFFLYKIMPTVFYMLPRVHATALVANVGFSLVPIQMDDYFRNFGCFREPGMFQVHLNLALIYELFSEKISLKRVILLCGAVVTTFSSAGFITTAIILLAFMWNKNDLNKSVKKKITFLSIISIALIIYLYINGYFGHYGTVFQKFLEFSGNGSAFERMNAVNLALKTIGNNPLLGTGWGNWANTFLSSGILTCTPLNWFAIYGVLYGCVCNAGIFLTGIHNATNRMAGILIAISIFFAVVSQDVSGDALILIIIFYAYSEAFRRKKVYG